MGSQNRFPSPKFSLSRQKSKLLVIYSVKIGDFYRPSMYRYIRASTSSDKMMRHLPKQKKIKIHPIHLSNYYWEIIIFVLKWKAKILKKYIYHVALDG